MPRLQGWWERSALMLAIMLTLLGCAHTVWVKPDGTQQEFARDSYECERDARQSGYFGSGLVGAINMQSFQERCMVARGWAKQTEQGVSGAPGGSADSRRSKGSGEPVDEQTQILNYCLERMSPKEVGQCRRDEAARRGLRSP